jgi:hypothetical protein
MSRLAELELALATGRISEALLSEESAAGQSAAWRAALTMARTFGSSGDYVALLRRVEEGAVAAEAVGAAGAAGGAAAAAVAALFGAPLAPSSEGERCDGFDELCGALAARAGAFVRGDGDDDEARQLRAFAVLLVGASLLSLFVQMNYTGPLLQTEDLVGLIPSLARFAPRDADAPAAPAKTSELHEDEDAHDEPVTAATLARALLCVDGEPVYVLAKWPSLILCARATLVALTRVLDADASANGAAADALCTARWWCARAIVVHHELIVSQLCEGSDTLREAATALFAAACAHPRVAADGAPHLADVARATARATLWLERGLALQVASHAEDASRCFDAAKLHAGLDCELTGITGRGTKFQKFDRAQLVLNTRSALAVYDAATVAAAAVATAAADDDGAAADDDDDDAPTIDGSVAAAALPPAPQQPSSAGRSNNRMREVTLESLDPYTHMLDVPRVRPESDGAELGAKVDEDGYVPRAAMALLPVEQLLLLALSDATQYRGAVDGLVHEEMGAYVAHVLQQPALNWTVHSHSLLARSLVEFETTQRRERALMQLQILVDQQEKRLSAFHSARDEAVAADAGQRLRYVYALSARPRWELQRILGRKYLQCGSLKSALDLFQRLQCVRGCGCPPPPSSL